MFLLDWVAAPHSHPDATQAMKKFAEFANDQYQDGIALLFAASPALPTGSPKSATRMRSTRSVTRRSRCGSAQDYLNREVWLAKLRSGELFTDLDDATTAYAHYMDGSGTDLKIDYEEAHNEDSNIRKAVDAEIASARAEAERIIRESGQTSFQMQGDPTSAGSLADGYPTNTENWQKTLGEHTIYGTSQVVVEGNQVTMRIVVHAEDMYNVNAGMADIATNAPDDENGRSSTLGWAKEFRTYGEVVRTITWTIGEAPGAAAGGGATIDREGEDRTDGRYSG